MGIVGWAARRAGFGGDLGIDLGHGSVTVFEDVVLVVVFEDAVLVVVFEDAVLVVEFGEPLGQRQLMSVAPVDPEGELPGGELAGEHAACEGSGGGFMAGLIVDRKEGEAEFVERCRQQVVHVAVRLGARAGGEDTEAGGVESGDERITGGVDDIARADFPDTPEGGMVLQSACCGFGRRHAFMMP
ncbi:hypothetical protein ACGF5F_15920 [Streptomyces sp. NPDC047821]|uniref:hypothetical protein n=1 Tax=Streptomyces sp. NPDC047821 TaxID=3365488 RepID=UPI0037122CB3